MTRVTGYARALGGPCLNSTVNSANCDVVHSAPQALQDSPLCRKQELLLYILPLALFDVIYPRRNLPERAPSFARLSADVFLSLFFYDLFFTIGHYVSHKARTLSYLVCFLLQYHRGLLPGSAGASSVIRSCMLPGPRLLFGGASRRHISCLFL